MYDSIAKRVKECACVTCKGPTNCAAVKPGQVEASVEFHAAEARRQWGQAKLQKECGMTLKIHAHGGNRWSHLQALMDIAEDAAADGIAVTVDYGGDVVNLGDDGAVELF